MASSTNYQIRITPQYLLDQLPSPYRQAVHEIFECIHGGLEDEAEHQIVRLAGLLLHQLDKKKIPLLTVFQCFDTLNGYFQILRNDVSITHPIAEILRLGSLLMNCGTAEDVYAQDVLRRLQLNMDTWIRLNPDINTDFDV